MPGPIFENPRQRGMSLGPEPRTRQAAAGSGKLLTTPRSARYLSAIGKLDGSSTMTPVELQDVIDAIHREFTEKWSAVPQGFVGHCYLGPPYEAHTLTISGEIIEHYQAGQPLPGRLEEARSLARTEHYLVIEVYTDRLVCVRTDGSVVTVGGS